MLSKKAFSFSDFTESLEDTYSVFLRVVKALLLPYSKQVV